MIEYVFYALCGNRRHVEELRSAVGLTHPIVEMPGGSTLDFELLVGTPQQAKAEELIKKYKLDPFRRRRVEATSDEIATARLFSNVGCCWIEDDENTLDPVSVTGGDTCLRCGSGIREHADPLRGAMRSLRKYHLVRKPPPWVLGSTRLVALVRQHGWSGVDVRPVIERTTGRESEEFSELWITSVLPSMHTSAGIERFKPSESCETCMRVGYQLPSRQAAYARRVVDIATDWNLSTEWLAPHFVPCPKLICSRRVVHELLKLEPSQKWIPVKLVDD